MIVKKLGTVVATAALLGSVMAPAAAFAESNTVQGNGAGSNNVIVDKSTTETTVTQSNATVAYTLVVASSNSGGNNANMNTGGDVSIETGKAVTNATVSVTGGNNVATVDDCGCPEGSTDNTIKNNGADSTNKIKDKKSKKTTLGQSNATVAGTGVFAFSDSGNNDANKNTDGSSSVKTKKSKTNVAVVVAGGHNKLNQ